MYRVGVRGPRRVNEAPDVEVTLSGIRRPDRDGRIGHPHVERVAVGVRVRGDYLQSEFAACACDPHRDLPAVRDEDPAHPYTRQTPGRMPWMGAFRAADNARPSTVRVSTGSMIPSSHNRAVL